MILEKTHSRTGDIYMNELLSYIDCHMNVSLGSDTLGYISIWRNGDALDEGRFWIFIL